MGRTAGTQPSLEDCQQAFLHYLETYRRYSAHTSRAYARDTARLVEFLRQEFPGLGVADVSRQHIVRFVSSLSDLAAASVCRSLDALSSWFGFLRDAGLVRDNPVSDVPRPRRPQRLPVAATPEDCRGLMAAAQSDLERLVLGLVIYLGIRKSELLAVNLEDFGPDLGVLRVNGKGQQQRELPVAGPLQRLLGEYLAHGHPGTGALLLNRAGRRLGATSLQRLFKRLVCRAGLEDRGLALHAMRHGAATQWLRAGADVRTIQKLLGHKSLETTARYLATDDKATRRAVDCLPDYLAEATDAEH